MATPIDSFGRRKKDAQDSVLIVTDDAERSAEISSMLRRNHVDVTVAVFDGQALQQTPDKAPRAILCCLTDYIATAPVLVAALKDRYAPVDISFIGALSHSGGIDVSIFDSVIFPPAHPVQIAGRVHSMLRLHKMQHEIMHRIETLRDDFGIDYEVTEPTHTPSFRVLFIGKATPEFMVVINALEARNVEVIAAFTSFSAFDFLHENPFDAVVMNMLNGVEPAFTISETMRRNSRLYHVPTLFLTGEDFRSHDLAYEKGASDIIPAKSDGNQISGRILELAKYHRLHTRLKDEFGALGGDLCTDRLSGAYNAKFFQAHLRRTVNANRADDLPTTMMMIKIRPDSLADIDPVRVNAAYHQIGRMIKNMVRMEDIVARLEDNVYTIAFPEQPTHRVETVIDRINGIVDSMAFQSGNPAIGAFTVDLDIVLLEAEAEEEVQDFILRGLVMLRSRDSVRLTG